MQLKKRRALSLGRVWVVRWLGQAVVACVALAPALSANAAGDPVLTVQLKACATVADSLQRLQCFDQLAQSVTSAPGTAAVAPTAPTAPVAPAAPAAPSLSNPATDNCAAGDAACKRTASTDDQIGDRYLKRERSEEEQPKVAVFNLVETKRNSRGQWYFYFDNGQVWRQMDSRTVAIPDPPVQATIKVGVFGSHKLSIGKGVRGIKIKRLE